MAQQNDDFTIDQYFPIMSAVIRNKKVRQSGEVFLGASIFNPGDYKKNKLWISFGPIINNILTNCGGIKPGDLIELRNQTYQSTVKPSKDIVIHKFEFPVSNKIPPLIDMTYISDPLNINSNKQSLLIKKQKQISMSEYEEKQIIDKYIAFNDHINYKKIYSNKKNKSNKKSTKRSFREMDNKENMIINDGSFHKKRKIMDITDPKNILIENENKNNQINYSQQVTNISHVNTDVIPKDIQNQQFDYTQQATDIHETNTDVIQNDIENQQLALKKMNENENIIDTEIEHTNSDVIQNDMENQQFVAKKMTENENILDTDDKYERGNNVEAIDLTASVPEQLEEMLSALTQRNLEVETVATMNQKRSDKEEMDIDDNIMQESVSDDEVIDDIDDMDDEDGGLDLCDKEMKEVEELKREHLFMPEYIVEKPDQLLQFKGDNIIRLIYDSEDERFDDGDGNGECENDVVEVNSYIESLMDLLDKASFEGDWIISKCGKYWERKDD